MADINIVLVEPEIPQNTGNIARTCAATGAALHLVKPLGFRIDDAKLKRAGLDYWHELDITITKGWTAFLEFSRGENLFYFTTKAPRSMPTSFIPSRVFLAFRKETAGLPEPLLYANPERCVRLPMRESRCARSTFQTL